MNRAERRRLKVSPLRGMQVRKLVWNGKAPPWCSWCGQDCGEHFAFVPFDPTKKPREPGFYACKWNDRDQVGILLVPGPNPAARAALGLDGADDRPGFLTCGPECAERIRTY